MLCIRPGLLKLRNNSLMVRGALRLSGVKWFFMMVLVAGCEEVILATPPRKDGSVSPEVLYVAAKCGIKQILLAGKLQCALQRKVSFRWLFFRKGNVSCAVQWSILHSKTLCHCPARLKSGNCALLGIAHSHMPHLSCEQTTWMQNGGSG